MLLTHAILAIDEAGFGRDSERGELVYKIEPSGGGTRDGGMIVMVHTPDQLALAEPHSLLTFGVDGHGRMMVYTAEQFRAKLEKMADGLRKAKAAPAPSM